jgi:small-conductance mechanosensitive channel
MQVSVAYREDLKRVKEVLQDVARANRLCLVDPEPLFIIQGFGDSALEVQFSIWAERTKWLEMRNTMFVEVKEAFDAAGIELPFPHRTLYAGSRTDPFPVRIVDPALPD